MIKRDEIKPGDIYYCNSGTIVRRYKCEKIDDYGSFFFLKSTSGSGMRNDICFITKEECEEQVRKLQKDHLNYYTVNLNRAKTGINRVKKELLAPVEFIDEVK